MTTSIRTLATIACTAMTLALAQQARAQLVSNGSFETTTNGNGQMGFNTDATGWTTGGYNFLYAPGTADTTGANGEFGGVSLYGPGNGSPNGLPATSPDGGNFVAADSDFDVGAISQTINGLTVGDTYTLSFDWAAAQQSGFSGPTNDNWSVSLGSDTQTTATLNIPQAGFSGWQTQSFSYTATSTSEVLSFLAGTTLPSGAPPFVLLDGVSLTQSTVPDAASTALLVGLAALAMGAVAWRRRLCRD
jgi:hypothetical protein